MNDVISNLGEKSQVDVNMFSLNLNLNLDYLKSTYLPLSLSDYPNFYTK